MLRPTFSGFQVAKTGIVTSQKLLDVTGQNITNINTEGYTRQRVDLYSIPYSGGKMQYSQWYGGIGRGVGDTGASQIRDPFLDIRYRSEAAKVGREDIMATALGDLENIFDEITRDGMNSYMSKFVSQLQSLSQTPSDPVIESTVKSAATMITQLFNKYSKQIDTVQDQQITYLEDGVNKANLIMDEIATLNKQIKEQNIHEDKALELNDKRNMLIDELSQLMNIETRRRSVDIGNGVTVEELSIISMDLKDPNDPTKELVLVDHDKFGKVEVSEAVDGEGRTLIKTLVTDANKNNVTLDPLKTGAGDPQLFKGELSGYLSFLNNTAEFGGSATYSVKDRGIHYYRGLIDTMANKFAEVMNNANMPEYTITGGAAVPNTKEKKLFTAEGVDPNATITAANIKISDDWRDTTTSYITNTRLEPKFDDDGNPIDMSAANDNILNMISKLTSDIRFEAPVAGAATGNFLFEGTLQEFLANITTTVALQKSNTESLYKNYGETLVAIDRSRASVSGVSLDEEGISLLTYNKSFSAASRFMTTLDEALNTLINSTGRVGL